MYKLVIRAVPFIFAVAMSKSNTNMRKTLLIIISTADYTAYRGSTGSIPLWGKINSRMFAAAKELSPTDW